MMFRDSAVFPNQSEQSLPAFLRYHILAEHDQRNADQIFSPDMVFLRRRMIPPKDQPPGVFGWEAKAVAVRPIHRLRQGAGIRQAFSQPSRHVLRIAAV